MRITSLSFSLLIKLANQIIKLWIFSSNVFYSGFPYFGIYITSLINFNESVVSYMEKREGGCVSYACACHVTILCFRSNLWKIDRFALELTWMVRNRLQWSASSNMIDIRHVFVFILCIFLTVIRDGEVTESAVMINFSFYTRGEGITRVGPITHVRKSNNEDE